MEQPRRKRSNEWERVRLDAQVLAQCTTKWKQETFYPLYSCSMFPFAFVRQIPHGYAFWILDTMWGQLEKIFPLPHRDEQRFNQEKRRQALDGLERDSGAVRGNGGHFFGGTQTERCRTFQIGNSTTSECAEFKGANHVNHTVHAKAFPTHVCKPVEHVARKFRLLQELTQYLILDSEMEIEEHEETLSRLFKAADDSDSESSSSSSTKEESGSSSSDSDKDRLKCVILTSFMQYINFYGE